MIWFDALTGKQALLYSYLYFELKAKGYDVKITCRDYDYVVKLFKLKGVNVDVIGSYGGADLAGKLAASLVRELSFLREMKDRRPLLHSSFTSPEAVRAAFKLNLPIVLLTDSPHSVYVNRLTIPLADEVIVPEATPPQAYGPYYRFIKFRTFKGVFEVIWARRFKPSDEVLKVLNLEPYSYVVFRVEEAKASYYPRSPRAPPTIMVPLIREVLNRRISAVVFTRYPDQEAYLRKLFGGKVIIPNFAVDSLSLAYYSLAVVTGGATMATEASLIGVPSITLFPRGLYVVNYLRDRGFPIYQLDVNSALNTLKEITSKGYERFKVRLNLLEDPLDLIIKTIERYLREEV